MRFNIKKTTLPSACGSHLPLHRGGKGTAPSHLNGLICTRENLFATSTSSKFPLCKGR